MILRKTWAASAQIVANAEKLPLDFKPGTNNKYSNFGYLLASALVEKVTGKDYFAYVKTTLLDRSLLLNASLFYQKYSDFQLNTFLGTSFVVRSIPEVKSKGVDIDMLWFTPVRGLSVQGGLTYALTKYGDQPAPNDPGNALALLPGSRLSLAPKYSASGALTSTLGAKLGAKSKVASRSIITRLRSSGQGCVQSCERSPASTWATGMPSACVARAAA